MVEIPDYLLERSREARARLSGAPASDSQSESTETAVVAATESAPVAPVSAPPEIEKVEPPKPVAPWVIAAKERKKISLDGPCSTFPSDLGILIWGTLEAPL